MNMSMFTLMMMMIKISYELLKLWGKWLQPQFRFANRLFPKGMSHILEVGYSGKNDHLKPFRKFSLPANALEATQLHQT